MSCSGSPHPSRWSHSSAGWPFLLERSAALDSKKHFSIGTIRLRRLILLSKCWSADGRKCARGRRISSIMERIDYHGWPDSVRLTNGDIEVVVLTAVGPRIIHYGFPGRPNVFNVIPVPENRKQDDKWVHYGGHRIWIAPEHHPRTYHPDRGPVGSVVEQDGKLTVANPVESSTGFSKELIISLAKSGSGVTVEHRITNHNVWAVSAAPWALSIVANGGKVVLPQEPYAPHEGNLLPARPIVLWKFTDMGDPRWRWGTKYITLTQRDDLKHAQKLGVYSSLGWGAHVTPEQVFVVHIDPEEVESYPDYGSNFETFTAGPFQELETLGPLETLEPGETAVHVQHWYLEKASGIADDDESLDKLLQPIVGRAKAAI